MRRTGLLPHDTSAGEECLEAWKKGVAPPGVEGKYVCVCNGCAFRVMGVYALVLF